MLAVFSLVMAGCYLDNVEVGDIIPGLGKIVLVEKQGPVEGVIAEATWEVGQGFIASNIMVAGESVIPSPLEKVGLSYSGSFSKPAQMVQEVIGGETVRRMRIPIAVSNEEEVTVISSMKELTVELKPTPWLHEQLTTPTFGENGRQIKNAPWRSHYSFYILEVRSKNADFIPEEWEVRFLTSASVELEWCQAAPPRMGGCTSQLTVLEKKSLIDKKTRTKLFNIVEGGSIWKQKLHLEFLEEGSISSVSIDWSADSSVKLLSVDPYSDAFTIPLITLTPPLPATNSGVILIENVWIQRRVDANITAAPALLSFGEPTIKNGLAVWKGRSGKSIGIPLDILESKDISELILPAPVPEGKKATTWGKIKSSE